MKKILLIMALFIMVGCASKSPTPINDWICKDLTRPDNLNTVYLLVYNRCTTTNKVMETLKDILLQSLTEQGFDVKPISSVKEYEKDGILISMDVLNAYASGYSKRIIVQYNIINRSDTLLTLNESIASRHGYTKIIRAISRKLTEKVFSLTECFKLNLGG